MNRRFLCNWFRAQRGMIFLAAENHMTAFTIRQAVAADLPTLVDFLARLALHVSGAPPTRLKKQERQRLLAALSDSLVDEDKRILVADVPDAGVVGMGYIFVWRNQGIWEQAEYVEHKSAMIDDVWVEPDFRKMGLFSAILKELVGFAEKKGAQDLVVEYSLTNKEAAAAWTKLGFEPTGVRAAAFTAAVQNALADR